MSSNSGLNNNQLAMMRMLLQQNQMPTIRTEPVQDVGQGIAQGIGNIVAAINQNRQQRNLLGYLDSELAKSQAEQAAASEAYRKYFGDHSVAYLPEGLQNKIYDKVQEGNAFQTWYDSHKEQYPTEADARVAYQYAIPETQKLLGMYQGRQEGFNQYGAPLVKTDPTTHRAPIDDLAGFNQYKTIFGDAPENSFGLDKQFYDMQNAAIEATKANKLLGYVVPQAQANLTKTVLDNQGQDIANQVQNIKLQFAPQLEQLSLDTQRLTGLEKQRAFQKKQAADFLMEQGPPTDPAGFLKWQTAMQFLLSKDPTGSLMTGLVDLGGGPGKNNARTGRALEKGLSLYNPPIKEPPKGTQEKPKPVGTKRLSTFKHNMKKDSVFGSSYSVEDLEAAKAQARKIMEREKERTTSVLKKRERQKAWEEFKKSKPGVVVESLTEAKRAAKELGSGYEFVPDKFQGTTVYRVVRKK